MSYAPYAPSYYAPASSSAYRSKSQSQPVIKKLCKVCQDAGKPEQEYTSHNIRETKDPSSRTVCPTLLALECRFCFKRGHTVKYCSAAKKQQNEPIKRTDVEANNSAKKSQTRQPKNVFMLLESDSDQSDSDTKEKEKIAPSPVTNASLKSTQKQALNYKSLIAVTEQQSAAKVAEAKLLREARLLREAEQDKKQKATKTSWIDAVSSSEEEYSDNEEDAGEL